jgi:hypothetical protein
VNRCGRAGRKGVHVPNFEEDPVKALSYSNVMATAAVFVALGGTSYAAVKITGDDVRNGSLTGQDVKRGSLTGRDVKNSSLRGRDVRDGSLRARDFRAADLPAGAKGDKGDKGDPGAAVRWLLIDENGDIAEQSGGFTVISKPGVNGQPATNPNVYVDAGASLVGKGLSASLAIQNRIDRTGDMVADPAFAGDVAIGRCNTVAVACAPAGTNADDTLVVRALADNTDVASQTRRVAVQVTS